VGTSALVVFGIGRHVPVNLVEFRGIVLVEGLGLVEVGPQLGGDLGDLFVFQDDYLVEFSLLCLSLGDEVDGLAHQVRQEEGIEGWILIIHGIGGNTRRDLGRKDEDIVLRVRKSSHILLLSR